MKKNFLVMVAICVWMAMGTGAMAQVRPTTRQASGTPKWVIYENLDASSVFVGKNYILYVEKGENNAVVAIDVQTGEKRTVIPGIAGIYEGQRPRIKKVQMAGNAIFFTLENHEGGFIYDWKSVQTSSPMTLVADLYVTTDHHALFRSTRSVNGKPAYDFWDLEQSKHLVSFAYDELGGDGDLTNSTVFISKDGCLWTDTPIEKWEGNNQRFYHGIKRITPKGRWDFFNLSTQSYVAENRVIPGRLVKKGDYIYRAAGRRIYRINTALPSPVWEEYAKIPPTQNSKFFKFVVDSKGNMLTNAGEMSNVPFNNQYWRVGAFDTPENLGKNLQTGFSQYGNQRIDPYLYSMRTDDNDNFMFLNSSGTTLYVYNPNGLVGYTKTAGTIVKDNGRYEPLVLQTEKASTQGKNVNGAQTSTAQANTARTNVAQANASQANAAAVGELGIFDLRGPVKQCTLVNEWGNTVRTFDAKGFWLTNDGKRLSQVYPSGIKRDAKGRIVKGVMDSEGNGEDYTYDAQGRVVKYRYHYYSDTNTETTTYDAQGNVLKRHFEEGGMDAAEPYTETYKNLEVDQHGNWTRRQVKSTDGSTSTQTRKIIYY